MECLALMLLNPAPERNPSNKRWDPEAQLNVKEIKVLSRFIMLLDPTLLTLGHQPHAHE
jgi:hypothetical protein